MGVIIIPPLAMKAPDTCKTTTGGLKHLSSKCKEGSKIGPESPITSLSIIEIANKVTSEKEIYDSIVKEYGKKECLNISSKGGKR